MSDLAHLESANAAYVGAGSHRSLPVRPARHLAVVTCMDARLDVFATLGLELGDVHVLRTAGGRVTDDVLRSLAFSTHLLGVTQVAVITHTSCGLHDPDGQLPATMDDVLGHEVDPHALLAFTDPGEAARGDAQRLLQWPDRPEGLVVAAYVLDVDTGELRCVLPATSA